MNKINMKKKMVGKIRYVMQAFAILLTAIGVFRGYPVAKALLLGVTFIMGPVFCGWICPFGTLQDFFGMLGDKLGIKKRTVSESLNKVLVCSRYVLLIITIFISADFIFNLLSLDPRSNLSVVLTGNSLTVIGWIVIGIFLGISLFFKRPFCNYLCIEGAKYGVFSMLRPVTIIRDKNLCINCNKCNKVCPMNINVSSYGQVRSLQCVNCMECVTECPVSNALTVSIIPVKGKKRKIVLPLIIASALSVFAFIVYNNINYDSLNIGVLSSNLSDKSTVITGESIVEYGDAVGIADGVYTGTGKGFRGEMTTEVTVQSEQITKIEVTETVDDAKWFDRAYSTVASEIISSQTGDVDSVSGATYSSMGIKEAVANALINAGGKNVEAIVNDLPEGGRSRGERPEGGRYHDKRPDGDQFNRY